MPKRSFVMFDTLSNDLVQYKGTWLMNCRVSSIDIDMRSKDEKLTIMEIFKQILASFHADVQLTIKKFQLDFSPHIIRAKNNALLIENDSLKSYSQEYAEYLKQLSDGKLDKINYFTIRTDRRCSYEEAKAYLTGIFTQIQRRLEQLSMEVRIIEGQELKNLYKVPEFIKEMHDYYIYGSEFKRTYIILNYPRNAFPNYLKPLLTFPHPIEITQHLHPYPKDKIIGSLEKAIAKLESTINMQAQVGSVSTETVVKKDDAIDLLNRLASGSDSIIEVGFYVTISANSLVELNSVSFELEGALRQLQVTFRRSLKDNNVSIKTMLPLCEDGHMDENYTFDTLSLARLVPFTSQDYTSGGVLYGINEQLAELITFDVFDMASYSKVVLGKPGYGKSTFAKLELGRQLSNGVQGIGIDNNKEYKNICKAWGGQYVEAGEKPNWNNRLIFFSGENKTKDLDIILNHLHNSPLRPRLVIVEEFQIIQRENKSLVLDLVQTVRKTFTSPTLITQNVQELLNSEEGRMIIDNSAMKFLMHQGENDVAAIENLFDLTKEEKLYLKTARIGHGYLITDLFRTKFKVEYSTKEHSLITTDPKDKIKECVVNG